MNWHTDTVTPDALERMLAAIRGSAGTIVRCKRLNDLVQVTWMALT